VVQERSGTRKNGGDDGPRFDYGSMEMHFSSHLIP
jgi:hypothetical protein